MGAEVTKQVVQETANYTPYVVATITLSGALIAQVISHWFSIRREDKKYLKECYQNLYSPVLWKVLKYMDAKTVFYKPLLKKDFDVKEPFEQALNIFGENLKYASTELIHSYENVKEREMYQHLNDQQKGIDEIQFCYDVLEETSEMLQKIGVEQPLNFVKYRGLCGIWLVVSRYFSYEKGCDVLDSSFEFNLNKLDEKLIKRIKHVLEKKDVVVEEEMLFIIDDIILHVCDDTFGMENELRKAVKDRKKGA